MSRRRPESRSTEPRRLAEDDADDRRAADRDHTIRSEVHSVPTHQSNTTLPRTQGDHPAQSRPQPQRPLLGGPMTRGPTSIPQYMPHLPTLVGTVPLLPSMANGISRTSPPYGFFDTRRLPIKRSRPAILGFGSDDQVDADDTVSRNATDGAGSDSDQPLRLARPAKRQRLGTQEAEKPGNTIHAGPKSSATVDSAYLYTYTAGPSNSTLPGGKHTTLPPGRECIACGDVVPTRISARCPCRHVYCRPCMRTLFNVAMTDESLFPPHCCHMRIPIEMVKRVLTKTIIDRFRVCETEYYSKDRTYCHVPTCSAFIPSTNVTDGKRAACPKCNTITCAVCKKAYHGGNAFEKDKDPEDLLALASKNEWKRCPRCNIMVERIEGCTQIICRCGYQFCYICTGPHVICQCRTGRPPIG